ncbi:hypothetical protein AB0B83_02820 [Micromonospora sp. NPDC049060]|uniref:hypothetical protein n=1 Tax=Micromonospora sp. NPDC049060 TaxID=3154828 RepID=UPI0033C59E0C
MRTTVTAARGARLLLLVGTLLGLAAMHTIGHDSHQTGHPANPSAHAAAAPGPHAAAPGPHAAAAPAPVPDAAPAPARHAAARVPVVSARHAAVVSAAHAALALVPPPRDVSAPHAAGPALQTVVGCPGGCDSEELLPAGGRTGGGLPGWGVCLAVLGAFTAALLLAALLSVRVRAVNSTGGGPVGAFPPPRAPPPRPVGLRLATVSVLRR